MNEKIQIGWSQISITPNRPVYVQGQLYLRISAYVRDPLTATALALEAGDEQAVLLSADLAGFHESLLSAVRGKLKNNTVGLDVNKVSFSGTHTHNSMEFAPGVTVCQLLFGKDYIPEEIQPQMDIPDNFLCGEEGLAWLSDQLACVVLDAWTARRPGGIATASDYAAVGFCRRPQFMENGKRVSCMYGACSQDNFIGMEGSTEHTANFMFTWDEGGNLTGVVPVIACPSQVHELHSYLTANYWTDARSCLREQFGDIFVLPLCSFAGDINPIDLVRISKDNEAELKIWASQGGDVMRKMDLSEECRDIGERIAEAAARAYKKARRRIENRPVFIHNITYIDVPVRTVTEESYKEALAEVEEIKTKFSSENRMEWPDVAAIFPTVGILARWDFQNQTPYWNIQCRALRIGDTALVTVPFETFVEYGFRLRARIRAREVIPVQLSNGMYGYLPTHAAVAGGSYTGTPASTPVSPEGGDMLIDKLVKFANDLF